MYKKKFSNISAKGKELFIISNLQQAIQRNSEKTEKFFFPKLAEKEKYDKVNIDLKSQHVNGTERIKRFFFRILAKWEREQPMYYSYHMRISYTART